MKTISKYIQKFKDNRRRKKVIKLADEIGLKSVKIALLKAAKLEF